MGPFAFGTVNWSYTVRDKPPILGLMVVFPWVVGLCMFALGTEWRNTGLFDTWNRLLHCEQTQDSWLPMSVALSHYDLYSDSGLYQDLFYDRHIKFQYPPTSLLFMYSVTIVSRGTRLPELTILNVLSWAAVLATGWYSAAVAMEVRRLRGIRLSFMNNCIHAAPLVLAAASFYPVVKAYSLGQLQTIINCMAAILVLFILRGKSCYAGAIGGCLCLLKPQYVLLCLWACVRKERSFVLGMVMVAAMGIICSVLLFGLRDHIEYFRILSFIARHGEAYYPNQSINGLMNRLLGNGENLRFSPYTFPPFSAIVFGVTTGGSLCLISVGFAVAIRASKTVGGSLQSLCVCLIVMTMASPVAWEHHYGVLLPIYAVLSAMPSCELSGAKKVALMFSYSLTSTFWSIVNRWSDPPVNMIQSYLLFGAMILLAILCFDRMELAAPVGRVDH